MKKVKFQGSPLQRKYLINGKIPVSQKFGEVCELSLSRGHDGHTGIDIVTKEKGVPIQSIAIGTVITTIISPGKGVIIQTKLGQKIYEIEYYHLSKILVRPGQKVLEGHVLGISGNTDTEVEHTHLSIKEYLLKEDGLFESDTSNGYGGRIDPESLMDIKTIRITNVNNGKSRA